MASNSISPRHLLVPVVCTDLGNWVHGRGGDYTTWALWDAVWTDRSNSGIAVATWTREGGRLPGICPGPGGLSAWSGWLVQAPACPGVRLSHAAPGVPPRPAPPTDITEDWRPKLSLWDLFSAWIRLLSTTRTSPTPVVAKPQFLEPLNQKKLLLMHLFSAGRAEEATPCHQEGGRGGQAGVPPSPAGRAGGEAGCVSEEKSLASHILPESSSIPGLGGAVEVGGKDGTHAEKNPSPARPGEKQPEGLRNRERPGGGEEGGAPPPRR